MLFSSPIFFVFFALYFAAHLIVPRAYRNWLIILGSAIFYGYWNVLYTGLPFALTLIAYTAALWLMASEDARVRKRRLIVGLIVMLLPLGFFKYTNFFVNDLAAPLLGFGERQVVDLGLPLGISFITFTLIAYVVNVTRGDYPLERGARWVLSYVLFFPHLIAGPILRPHELIPQLKTPRPARWRAVTAGLAIFSVGLVKKLVFADQIAIAVDTVYANPAGLSALDYLLAIYGFSLQIYCDFSGYTDMAIGLALAIGVRLPNNFRSPYASRSIAEFWRRWHITLSHWLRDYLYIPLGGSHRGPVRQVAAVMITMTLGGLWHGAAWTFVIWGLLHGLGVAVSQFARRWFGGTRRMPRWLAVLITFHIVTALWIFFRAPDLATAGTIAAGPFIGTLGDPARFFSAHAFHLALLAVFFLAHPFDDHRRIRLFVRRAPAALYWPAIAFLWVLAITISTGSSAKFIYFDF